MDEAEPPDKPDARQRLKTWACAEALALGLTEPRIVAASGHGATLGAALTAFLDADRHGSMAWMAERAAERADPEVLWPDVRSILVVGLDYGPDEDALAATRQPGVGAISVYARGRDYHGILKGKLKQLAGRIGARGRELGLDVGVKVFVDTAPVMEKPLAAAAGLGWQGKHTNLVSRGHGSWLFLGEIFLDVELPADAAEIDHCGSCRACLSACPTGAFPAPYQLDARRCISYLTIEHPGPIPRDLRPLIGNRIYGCDDCLAVCPWNKFARMGAEAKLAARDDLRRPSLADLAALDDAGFRALFAASPVKRIGRDRFVRNVLVAIGNSGDVSHVPRLIDHLAEPSAIVRGTAVWALSRLVPPDDFARFAAVHLPAEEDADVRAEWAPANA
ncbi:MAG: tRNA epoxyqueuosine(34) reductase QueG [Ancalomicrobiaceae bacterium]|nr:tRNA epoxyqueuosine(34) reductase QueG [Ancalomicrobiaceae bacterium]